MIGGERSDVDDAAVLPGAHILQREVGQFEKGKISVVPGLENRVASVAGRLIPRSILTGVLRPLVERAAMR